MSVDINKVNNNQLLLPPKKSNKKTLVLDLDETLVHSQFMPFSDPSDLVIQIDIENEKHDIHVMIRPGVKEFLEKMGKLFEIVVFTASVSKYADPLLDLIDKKGYCPYRLFREHCSLINTTFVKDLERLGRDLKNIIIVDNSPLSYLLHPENGLPILTWFEDKSDRELYLIMPILQFLSSVPDVRDFIPKFVDSNNTINYKRAKEIIKNYNATKYYDEEKRNSQSFNKNYNSRSRKKDINIQIINNNSKSNISQNKYNNRYKINSINNKENLGNNKGKVVELSMKNIIASVSPSSSISIPNHYLTLRNSKNKIITNNQKNVKNGVKRNSKEKMYMKIDLNKKIMNIKKLSNNNNNNNNNNINNEHPFKKIIKNISIPSIDIDLKYNKHHRRTYNINNYVMKNEPSNLSLNSKSIFLNHNNNNYQNKIKTKNTTPKVNKTINFLNANNHITRSVKYSKKTNTYIVNSTPGNNFNKLTKSLTRGTFNLRNNNNNENLLLKINNNKIYKNNNIYKTLSTSTNSNEYPNHKKQKSYNDFNSLNEMKKLKIKNNDRYKVEHKKTKNNFLKSGSIQHKLIHNNTSNIIHLNLSNNFHLSKRYNNSNNLSINNIDFKKANRGNNHIKFTHTSGNLIKPNSSKNYSSNNRYDKKPFEINITNKSQYIRIKNPHKNYSLTVDKKNSDYKNKEHQNKFSLDSFNVNNRNKLYKIKTLRHRSSNTFTYDNKINNYKNQYFF